MILGAHVSIQGGFSRALERALEQGFDCLQFFGSSPRSWSKVKIDKRDIRLFREMKQETGTRAVFIHSIYLVSLVSSNEEFRRKSVESLRYSLMLSNLLDAQGVITHIGSVKEEGREKGKERLISSIREVFDSVDQGQLIFENSASKGGVIGGNLEELGQLIELSQYRERINFCLDTAHAYAYGYDVKSQAGLEKTLQTVDQSIGLDRLKVIHLNDSVYALGTNRDRHANIGQGEIGWDGFKAIVNNPCLKGLPFIMEAPGFKTEEETVEQIRRIRSLEES